MRTMAILGILALLVVPTVGWTQTISIDFDTQWTDPSGNWNTVAYPWSASNLIDFNTGLATTVDISGDFGYHGTGGWNSGDIDWVDADAADDYGSSPVGGTATVTISELPATEYRVEIVASRSTATVADYTIDGAFANRTHNGPGTSDDWDAAAAYSSGNWMVWDSVTPVGGQITIQVTSVSGLNAPVNALMITDVLVPVELVSLSVE